MKTLVALAAFLVAAATASGQTAQELQKPPAQTATIYMTVQPQRQLVVPIPTWPANEPAPILPIPAWNLNNPASMLVQVSSSLQPAQSGRMYSEASASNEGPHVSGKFGDLSVTVTNLSLSPQPLSDRNRLVAYVSASNTGRSYMCTRIIVTLNTTLDLHYTGKSDAPQVREILPGRTNSDAYVFDIKNGVKPLELVFGISPLTILSCDTTALPHRDTWTPERIRLDISGLPIATPLPGAPQAH